MNYDLVLACSASAEASPTRRFYFYKQTLTFRRPRGLEIPKSGRVRFQLFEFERASRPDPTQTFSIQATGGSGDQARRDGGRGRSRQTECASSPGKGEVASQSACGEPAKTTLRQTLANHHSGHSTIYVLPNSSRCRRPPLVPSSA